MLKVYKIHNYVSIDGSDWREVIWSWCGPIQKITSNEPPETEYLLNCETFDRAYEYLQNNELDGLGPSTTFWIDRPTIWVRYDDAYDTVSYRRFNTISYKREYEEWANVTLEWIIKNLPADTAIQYLKERGIATCPMNFLKGN